MIARRPFLLLLAGLPAVACGTTPSGHTSDAPDTPHTRELVAWQQEREATLRSDTGYLALAGLYWLQPGTQTFGSAADNDLVFPQGVAERAGVLELEGDAITLNAQPGTQMQIEGRSVHQRRLVHDGEGEATRVELGRVTFWVIERAGRFGIRLQDPQSPILQGYAGTERFEIDPAWRLEARWEPHDQVIGIAIPNVMGSVFEGESLGKLRFRHGAREHVLEATGESERGLFFVFADPTNGEETYGGGRFLVVPTPDADGRCVIDFNRAYNPPCAYSPFTTCPLPIDGNHLPFRVPAGEKAPSKP